MKSINVTAIADTHGDLPAVPACDLFIHAGDFSPVSNHSLWYQHEFIQYEFIPWLESIEATEKVVISGNHDFLGEYPEGHALLKSMPAHYLMDETVELFGLKVHGSPWTPQFYDWAYMANDWDLLPYWNAIPNDVDVLVTHGPPFGKFDLTPEGKRVGSESLAETLLQIDIPRLHVFGHIHEAYGAVETPGGIVANVAYGYHAENPPFTCTLEI